jgi:hypothetical protein
MLTRRRLPWNTPNAIEAKQAEFSTEPEIAVACLGNRVRRDDAFEEAVADLPRSVRVLADIERWLEGGGAGAAEKDCQRGNAFRHCSTSRRAQGLHLQFPTCESVDARDVYRMANWICGDAPKPSVRPKMLKNCKAAGAASDDAEPNLTHCPENCKPDEIRSVHAPSWPLQSYDHRGKRDLTAI